MKAILIAASGFLFITMAAGAAMLDQDGPAGRGPCAYAAIDDTPEEWFTVAKVRDPSVALPPPGARGGEFRPPPRFRGPRDGSGLGSPGLDDGAPIGPRRGQARQARGFRGRQRASAPLGFQGQQRAAGPRVQGPGMGTGQALRGPGRGAGQAFRGPQRGPGLRAFRGVQRGVGVGMRRGEAGPLELDAVTVDALHAALLDEYAMMSYYRRAAQRFGPVRPFVHLLQAERRHAQALVHIFERGRVIPPRPAEADEIAVPDELIAAIEQALQRERANADLYTKLRAEVSEESVRVVFDRLRTASEQRHVQGLQRALDAWSATPKETDD
jgi:rubrerythrin